MTRSPFSLSVRADPPPASSLLPYVANADLRRDHAQYSDLLNDGERDVRNYFEQLRRCAGPLPLNVFATMNNRWIINETAHESWEAEFLSDRIANKARQTRATMREEGMIFTRPGALLNLKLLLGLQPPTTPFKKTAIGAIALHANDYIESEENSSLAHGTLPVIAEFAPRWELQNPRNPRQLLCRSFYLYDLLQRDERMQALFATPLPEVTFAGLRFSEYFGLLFGMHTNASSGIVAAPYPTSILDAVDIATKAHFSIEQFTMFAASKALTLPTARTTIDLPDEQTFRDRITTPAWTTDHRTFRGRPLLQLDDGRYLVLDLQFLFESASAGLSWTLMEHLSREDRARFLEYWGGIFEQYVQDLLAHYYAAQAPVSKTYAGGQIDALLVVGDDLVVLEVKAGFLPEEAKGARDPAIIDAALRKKYVQDERGRRVGIRQLATMSNALLAGTVAGVPARGRVYPVLVGEDPLLQTPGVNIFLNDVFREEISDDRIMPLTVMLIDEVEELLPNIDAGEITWQDVFSPHCTNGRVAGAPVHTTLVELAMARRFRRRPNAFLAQQAKRLIAIINDTYQGLA